MLKVAFQIKVRNANVPDSLNPILDQWETENPGKTIVFSTTVPSGMSTRLEGRMYEVVDPNYTTFVFFCRES